MVVGVNLVQKKSGPEEKQVPNFDVPEKTSVQSENDFISRISQPELLPETRSLDWEKPEANLLQPEMKKDYIQAFIDNPVVRETIPNLMNWLNIGGNTLSFVAHAFGFGDGVKSATKAIGSFTTKAFMIANSFINIVERCYAKNFLSALGYLNDIFIAGTVNQDDTYLARGTASGTYNMANSLAMSIGKKNFSSIDDHISSTVKAFKKFFTNCFSGNIFQNFLNHENGMWAIFGGIFANLGALSWMLSGKIKVPTLVRDVAGVMMDIEQLNPGHLKAGRKNYFFSGVTLAVGTIADLFTRLTPQFKHLLVPLTFIFDGIGRHLLRLHQNERELKEGGLLASPT